jgi:hypothetical protein
MKPLFCCDNSKFYASTKKAAKDLSINPSTISCARSKAISINRDYFFCAGFEFEIIPIVEKTAEQKRLIRNLTQKKYDQKKSLS